MAYIVNRYGIIHTIPDDWMQLPTGARPATDKEIADFEAKDKEAKKRIRAEKREAANRRAQLVVMREGEDEPEAAKKEGK